MKACIFGTQGEMANAIDKAFCNEGWEVKRIRRDRTLAEYLQDVYVFPQGVWLGKSLLDSSVSEIQNVVEAGLLSIIRRVRETLFVPNPDNKRVDCVILGSTSAYAGFADSSVYCAVKHGLLGFVRAMNEEYKHTNRRFHLVSMGTMNTAMGRQLTDQDEATFLSPDLVAKRIVDLVSNPDLFEPEVIIRRRHVR